jgi:hypothetical protein
MILQYEAYFYSILSWVDIYPLDVRLLWDVARSFEYKNDYVKLNIKIKIFKIKTDLGVFLIDTHVYKRR